MPSEAAKHTFVLVHGAWHGGWCWRRVTDLLTARGHEVFAPTLTGLGDRSHLASLPIDLSTQIEDVVRAMQFEDLSNVVLVGHSYGGFVISGVAERLEKSIKSIVFLDAFVPDNGMSLSDYWPPDRKKLFEEMAASTGWKTIPAPSAAFFKVNEKDQAWADSKSVPHPYPCFTEKARLTGARERIVKKAYVRAAEYTSTYFSMFYEKYKNDPAWRTYAVPCGHDVMIDMPQRLVDILEEVA